jgi:hypothetical protein
MACSHEGHDVTTWQQLVGNVLVAPSLEAGNPRAMPPGHACDCWPCEERLHISAQEAEAKGKELPDANHPPLG